MYRVKINKSTFFDLSRLLQSSEAYAGPETRSCSEVNATKPFESLNATEKAERLRCYFIDQNDYQGQTSYLIDNFILSENPQTGNHYKRGLQCIQHGMETTRPGFCDTTYDLTTCVRQTPVNTMFEIPCSEICPSHAVKNHTEPCHGFAYRYCNFDGHWDPVTNYTECQEFVQYGNIDFNHTRYLEVLHSDMPKPPPDDTAIVTVSALLLYWLAILSMLCLFISFFLFRLRNLRCTRIYIHQNMIVAWFFKYLFVVLRTKDYVDPAVIESDESQNSNWDNWQISCVILHEFFYLAGHAWFFVEALYLHHQISYGVFGSSSLKLKHFAAIGWSIPILFTIPWAILAHFRYMTKEQEAMGQFFNSEISSLQYELFLQQRTTWRNINDLDEQWLISGPIWAMIFIATILLIICLRTILSKIQATATDDTETFKKTLKATLALVPLFGLSILVGLHGGTDQYSTIAHIQMFVVIIIQNTQGFFISVLYCFTNKEVIRSLRSKFTRMADRHSTVFYSRTTDISTLGTSISEDNSVSLTSSISRGLKRVSSRAGTRPSNLSVDRESKKLDNRGESLLANRNEADGLLSGPEERPPPKYMYSTNSDSNDV